MSFENLPKEARDLIQSYIFRLQDLEITKSELIKELAEKIEENGWVPPEYISGFLKKILKDIISERTIETALGVAHKEKRKRYQPLDNRNTAADADKKTIEVSSSGEQEVSSSNDTYTNPVAAANPIPEPDESAYVTPPGGDSSVTFESMNDARVQIANEQIDILQKELEEKDLRLNEAFSLIEDKDKRIQELELQQANIEVELGQLKKKDPVLLDRIEIENERLRAENEQLHAVEAIHTRQQDFKPASSLPVKQIWIAAINALNLFIPLRLARDKAINENTPWRKLIFEIAEEDGQVKSATLEPKQE